VKGKRENLGEIDRDWGPVAFEKTVLVMDGVSGV